VDADGTGVAGRWLREVRDVLDRLERTQMPAIAQVAERCARTIAGDGLVHLFGTGHSRIPVEEMFPRYGSFPGFHPLAELSMTFHTQVVGANGQRQAMFIERIEGLAECILANFVFGSDDVFMVFSASGATSVPIEMAMGARERGLHVVAVTSVAHSLATPSGHPSGTRLLDHADVVIDTCTPPGDALVTLEGTESPVGPGSTMSYTAIVNEIKVQTAAHLIALDAMPPVITSANVIGPGRAQELFEEVYAEHGRRLARVLSTSVPDTPAG
jgi:uncharacterized phosphosugar-binding protein